LPITRAILSCAATLKDKKSRERARRFFIVP